MTIRSVRGFKPLDFLIAVSQSRDLVSILFISTHRANAAHFTRLRAGGFFGNGTVTPAVHIYIGIVDPFATVAGQYTIISTGGAVATNVLAVCQSEAQVQGVAVTQEIVGQALACIDCSANAVHPTGALGEVKLAQAIVVMLPGQGQAILQDLIPQIFRNVRIVHQAAAVDAAQIEAHIRCSCVAILITVLFQHFHHRIGCRYILFDSIGIGCIRNAKTHGSHVQNDISRTDLSAGIHKMIIKVVGIECGISFLVPRTDRYRMVDHIAHIRILEVKLILITRASGRSGDHLAVHTNFDITGIKGFAGVCRCLYRKGKVTVA